VVSKEEVIALMMKYFRNCPICRTKADYEVSGVFKNYVQCTSCLAKWMSNDFIGGKEIKTLQLWETDKEGKSEVLLKETKPVSFWQSLDLEKSATQEREAFETPKGVTDAEYKACMDNLGLLEGEGVRLHYVCFRNVMSPPSAFRKLFVDDGGPQMETKKGLLVFTNDNMIFMQQEGAYSSNYAQALRIPLDLISGVVSGGTFIPHIRILVGLGGPSEQHEFVTFQSAKKPIHKVRGDIEKLLKEVRQEKKRLAQEALVRGTVPAMIFCKFCGTRNKTDKSHCINCGAPLT
jgi:hypothetical protein